MKRRGSGPGVHSRSRSVAVVFSFALLVACSKAGQNADGGGGAAGSPAHDAGRGLGGGGAPGGKGGSAGATGMGGGVAGHGGAGGEGVGGTKGAPAWSALPSLSTQRMKHTITTLADGRILIVGGWGIVYDQSQGSKTNPTATAEIYDPLRETFTVTGSMATTRHSHTATLLPNGKVLIAGGANGAGNGTAIVTGVELYDPTTGTFQPTGNMLTPRRDHTATLLDDGKVLIAGGISSTAEVASCELYDPATGTFLVTGSMASTRTGHTATQLKNGKVLLVGGQNFTGAANFVTAELYDPATGTFSKTGALSTRRDSHSATLLTDGRVLVVGGQGDSAGLGFATAEIYDPASGLFTLTGSLTTQRYSHTATLLGNGRVLIAAGMNGLGGRTSLASAELFDPATGTFLPTGTLVNVRTGHRAVRLTTGKVLLVGGQEAANCSEIYDPETGTFSSRDLPVAAQTATLLANGKVLFSAQIDYINPYAVRHGVVFDPATNTFTATGPMVRARAAHTATLLENNKVLFVGTYPWTDTAVLLRAELYDPMTGLFDAQPSTVSRYAHTATLLPDGNVLLAGGSPPSTSTVIYDASGGTFSTGPALLTGRYGHTATRLANGKVLLVGGWGGSIADGYKTLASAELYDPISKTFTNTGPLSMSRISSTASLLPDGRVLVVGGWSGSVTSGGFYSGQPVATAEVYNVATGTFTSAGALATARFSHAAATLPDGKILIAGGSDAVSPANGATEVNPLASVELYDPASATFKPAPAMTMPRVGPTATVLQSGKVLVAGGNAAGLNNNETVARVEMYW